MIYINATTLTLTLTMKEMGILRNVLIITSIILLSMLIACQPVKDDDVMFNHEGEITSNLDKLEKFIQNVKDGNEDKIRIVRNTTEGDPIFDTLNYNGENIKYTYDNSHDEFGGSDRGKKSATCTNLESEDTEKGSKYYLSDCSSDIGNHFYFQIPE